MVRLRRALAAFALHVRRDDHPLAGYLFRVNVDAAAFFVREADGRVPTPRVTAAR